MTSVETFRNSLSMMRNAFAYLLVAAVALISYGPAGMPMASAAPMAAESAMAMHGDMASMPCADCPMDVDQQADNQPNADHQGMDQNCPDIGKCMALCAMLPMAQPISLAFEFSHYPELVVAVLDSAAAPQAAAALPFRPPRSSILS